MTAQYKGMRWLKCNLHMHTPADSRHWTGDPMNSGQEAEAAKAFAEACYQEQLDVVGIVDHNFLCKDFLPHLKQAFDEIESEHNHRIVLFPGFEFEANVGRGIHVVCLFDPGIDSNYIDHLLTECGVGQPRVNGNRFEKSTKNLTEILSIVQKQNDEGTWKGLVIVPHVFDDSLFDNDRISEWLQQDQFKNQNLFAVEVPKPVCQMNYSFQKLFYSGEDCQPEWKRIRPIATLMSSDSKKLIESDASGKPTPNSIGYRYSWIKMSEPSIESLRQAFLDHQSRIILPDDVSTDTHPAERNRQAEIQSISIKNVAFLADQDIFFSPNFNCVIGGRGSGKSTLLEYLRIVFMKAEEKDLDKSSLERIKRVRETLNNADARLEVCWKSADGVEDKIEWTNGNSNVLDREMPDPETFFKNLPLRFYSQQQINRLTEASVGEGSIKQAQRLLELVDGFKKGELNELYNQESRLKIQIKDAFNDLRKIDDLGKELKRLQQEYQELDRQWKARSEIQEDVNRHQLLKSESKYLDGLLGPPGEQFLDVADLADKITASHVTFEVKGAPHEEWFTDLDKKVKAAKDTLAKTIRDEVDKFTLFINELKTKDAEWATIHDELEQADDKFSQACEAKGLTTDDVGHLQEISKSRFYRQRKIDEMKLEIEKLQSEANDPENLMEQLHQIWKDQYKKREEAAERANKVAVLNENGQRFIEVSTKYQQDQNSFLELWNSLSPTDGRTRLGKNWENIGNKLFDRFVDSDKESPWQLLHENLSDEDGSAGNDFGDLSGELYEYMKDNSEDWERLRQSRVHDTVDMKLFRADGTFAGSISGGSLSDGQRNTAALALLLAQEGGPLIVDQPEDELDSNFVFRELIPMLRTVKTKRQLIMATHNANLPVNGDAELVYAFEARGCCGEILAQGGLDKGPVIKAVLDVMEGTEEAFRRRREKYNF